MRHLNGNMQGRQMGPEVPGSYEILATTYVLNHVVNVFTVRPCVGRHGRAENGLSAVPSRGLQSHTWYACVH